MWNIESTTRLLKAMSQSTEPDELVRLFFDHVRRSVDVQRALVLSRAALSPPQYRVVHNVHWKNESNRSVVTGDEVREGGILAEILCTGEFENIAEFAPDKSDPAFDLLCGSRSLMAFPLFEKGMNAGSVVMLGSSPGAHKTADLCVLAMVSSLLGRAIEAQKLASQLEITCRALDSELEAAADIQRWLLPSLPMLDNVKLAASYRTSRHSGGDYYDVGLSPDGRLGVLIADVSGKGAPAAVIMAILRSIVHEEMDRTQPAGPAALLDYADQRLRTLGLPQRGVFVTAFCGKLDPVSGMLTFSCAGHNPPRLLCVQDRMVVPLDGASTTPLGLLDEAVSHTEKVIQLMSGDLVLFYTDGITEARSPEGEFFCVERLDKVLRDLPDPPTPDAAIKAIAKEVTRFEQDGTPADDQTLLALERLMRHA